MPANRMNYFVIYKGCSQVYGTSSKEVALSSPPPSGYSVEDKSIYFVAVEPDNDRLVWYKVPEEEVLNAEIIEKKTKAKET
jgi:hypothetical protein